MQSVGNFFLGRQPIVGREMELVAYELLLRGGKGPRAEVTDDVAATAAVIQHAVYDLGLHRALGGKMGFINVSADLLMSSMIEALPPRHLALEILETVELTDELAARCAHLAALGFTLALDDVVALTPAHQHILPFVKLVKVDVLDMPDDRVLAITRELQAGKVKVKLLAEKVETQARYELCHRLGYDLFQGYFFAKPTTLTGKIVTPATMALVRLTWLLAADADIDELEDELKQAPDLVMRLLRLANSIAFNPSVRRITSLRDAIIVMGRIELSRLAQVLLFSKQSHLGLNADPLVQLAASRGRMMEGLAKSLGLEAMKDNAFMVGMLSLADALFGLPVDEIVRLFHLDDAMRDALCDQTGPLGQLLQLIKMTEQHGADVIWDLAVPLGALSAETFNRVQVEALDWAGKF
jgi:EAL and modified HD-GYP domain-containing signal transduction protein